MGNLWLREGRDETSCGLCCVYGRNVVQSVQLVQKPDDVEGLHKQSRSRQSLCDRRVTSRYELKALIGCGAFSRVVRVEDKRTKEPLAIKIVESHCGNFHLLKTELSILCQVQHPNIIQMKESYVDDRYLYIVMELASGGDLYDKMAARGKFSEKEASCIADMLLDGLDYLHSNGITHRDLKPENLLYRHPGSDSRIMISDFGLSHFCQDPLVDIMVTPCGTPEFIAPEMLRRKQYTRAVDMWALGVIVYILMSAHFPFYHNNQRKLYKRIARADYSYGSQLLLETSLTDCLQWTLYYE
ncbi:serine/threonine-protein kinase H1 homolog isoform X2 [Corticium candelabrum]|uniref:serine/threonine-protein kinase H1 homolog isoform X2 n=1 Tax=Corticium candelabrum TaxID=121492 RepID=UPI002E264A0A|nr:serine/threonine-protein kinase H1 homolog isoform X2 [Corticium candelabrum]